MAWSPDGTQLASVDGASGQVWEAFTGKWLFSLDRVRDTVAWSPDGKCLAGGYDNAVQVQNATKGEVIAAYTGHTEKVTSVVWSPDGTRLASASEDKTVRVWAWG